MKNWKLLLPKLRRLTPLLGIISLVLVLVAWLIKAHVTDELASYRARLSTLGGTQAQRQQLREIMMQTVRLRQGTGRTVIDLLRIEGFLKMMAAKLNLVDETVEGEWAHFDQIEIEMAIYEQQQQSAQWLRVSHADLVRSYDLAHDMKLDEKDIEVVGQRIDKLSELSAAYSRCNQELMETVTKVTGTFPPIRQDVKSEDTQRILAAFSDLRTCFGRIGPGGFRAIDDAFAAQQLVYDLGWHRERQLANRVTHWRWCLYAISFLASALAIMDKAYGVREKSPVAESREGNGDDHPDSSG